MLSSFFGLKPQNILLFSLYSVPNSFTEEIIEVLYNLGYLIQYIVIM